MEIQLKAKRPQNKASSLFKLSNDNKEDDKIVEVAPIPVPLQSSTDAPLLDVMKRTRDDPQKLEEYIKSRPIEPQPTDEVFNRVPIEAFGKAMLAGMGFKEGEGEVRPCLLEGRPNLLGLGAKPKPQDDNSRARKRNYLTIGCVGLITGTHKYAVASQVDGVPGLDMIRVRSFKGGDTSILEEVEIPKSKFSLTTDLDKLSEDHPAHRVQAAYENFMREEAEKANAAFRKRQRAETKKPTDTWVQEGLRVLLVDERDEATYKKKAMIVSVDEKGRCDVRLDQEKQIIQGVKSKYLQTVVPDKSGATLVVVSPTSSHQGEHVTLLLRDKHKGKAIVRDVTGREVTYSMDDVCELAT